jgi:transcriptional regulator with XRE-family HTH domain
MNKNLEVLTERLTTLKRELSVAAFASKCNIAQPMMDRYIKGDNVPSAEKIKQICVACGCSADWLLGLSDADARQEEFEFMDRAYEQNAVNELQQRLATSEKNAFDTERQLADAKQQIALLKSRMEGLEFALKAIGRERTAQDAPRERTYTEQEMRTIVRNIERRNTGRKGLRR